ncbi:MAG TPA: hypothetical protein VGD98_04205 [Ktedonobacteraceae bacterium]
MPVLATERRGIARSALRYRPIDPGASEPGPAVKRQRRSRPDLFTTTAPVAPEELDLEGKSRPQRSGRTGTPVTSDEIDTEEESRSQRQRRAGTPVTSDDPGIEKKPRPQGSPRTAAPVPTAKAGTSARARRHFHPLFFVGLGLLATVLLWVGVTQLLVWGTNTYNTIVYGYPRTFQIDQAVGHHDSPQQPSHFIAMNLKGHIIVIEMPGGDVSKSIVFSGPTLFGSGGDLAPVTLTFEDVQHNGKLAMIIHVQGNQFVFLNQNGTFVSSS